MKRAGFFLTLQATIFIIILCIVIAMTGGGAYYAYNNARNNNIKNQAQSIDKALTAYAQRHKGIDRKKLKASVVNNNYGPIYEQQLDFPIKLTNKGAIYNNRSDIVSGDDFGFIDRSIRFFDGTEAAFKTSPENHLYQFFYIPLDESGNKLSPSDKAPVAFYQLMVYIKTFQGGVTLYESPGSYSHLPAKLVHK